MLFKYAAYAYIDTCMHTYIHTQTLVLEVKDAKPKAIAEGFPAILLKSCERAPVKSIHIIFQRFLDNGRLPSRLNGVIICPIHKSGSRSFAQNHKTVTLTYHVSDVIQRIVRGKLITFLKGNCLLGDTRDCIGPDKCCVTKLLQNYDYVLNQLLTTQT